MLLALLKKQFAMIYGYFTQGRSGKKGGRAVGVLMLAVFAYLAVNMVVMSGAVSSVLLEAWSGKGYAYLCFSVLGCTSVVVSAVFGLFTAKAQLYEAKDNDLLLSMPIPVRFILLCRIIPLYAEGFIINAVVMVPAFVQYVRVAPLSASAIAAWGMILLILPLFSLSFSLVLAFVFAKISRYVRYKAPVALGAAAVFIAGYYWAYIKVLSDIDSFIANFVRTASVFERYLKISANVGKAAVGVASSMAVFPVILAVFGLIYALLAATYIKTVTSRRVERGRAFVRGEIKSGSRSGALLSKEFLRFANCTVYLTNCGLGAVILLLGAVFLAVRGRWLYNIMEENLAGYVGLLPFFAVSAAGIVSAMDAVSASSVSLEGKSLWILQSLPVSRREIIRAKLGLHFLVTAPASALFTFAAAVVFRFSLISGVLAVLLPPAVVLLLGEIGLMLNLRFPVFDWENEAYPVKQSMCAGAAIFSGIGLVTVLSGVMIWVNQLGAGVEAGMACGLAIVAVADFVLYRVLLTSRADIFAK